MTAPAPQPRTFLVTGATGFLGKVMLEELLRRRAQLGVNRVLVVVRPLRGLSAHERFAREVAASPCMAHLPPGWTELVTVLEADLERPMLPASLTEHPHLGDVTHVIHAAASVRFNLPIALAARANIHAALNMLTLARQLPRVERFVYVSTAYVSTHGGANISSKIPESLVELPAQATQLFTDAMQAPTNANNGAGTDAALLSRSGHPNSYTYTKAIAEHLVVQRRGLVPVSIVRPSVVTASRAHPMPGWIDSSAGIAGVIMLGGSGHLRVLVAVPEARIDVVPVDDVSNRTIAAALTSTPEVVIRHLVAGADRSPTVRQYWRGTQRYFTTNRLPAPARLPGGWFLGPPGAWFQVAELIEQQLPLFASGLRSKAAARRAAKMRRRLTQLNRDFGYFTTRTFDFQTSVPLEPEFDGASFIHVVFRGVHQHLLAR